MWWQNIYSNIHYIDLLQSPFLPVLGELLVTLWKQGLLGLPAVSKEERWQHHKVSLSCLLGSPILLSGSCSVLASHSGLCVPSTRWMLADGKTILPFNYLKRGMQINLWHSMTECHLCGPRSIFDALSLISFLIRLCILLWCAVFTRAHCSFCGFPRRPLHTHYCALGLHYRPCPPMNQKDSLQLTSNSLQPFTRILPLTSLTKQQKFMFSRNAGINFWL